MIAYFAKDGNYGDARELFVLDTYLWSDVDWEEIMNETDNDRLATVWEIAKKYV